MVPLLGRCYFSGHKRSRDTAPKTSPNSRPVKASSRPPKPVPLLPPCVGWSEMNIDEWAWPPFNRDFRTPLPQKWAGAGEAYYTASTQSPLQVQTQEGMTVLYQSSCLTSRSPYPGRRGGYKIYQLHRGDPLALPPPHRLQAAWADLSREARAQLLNIQYPQSNTIQALLLLPQGLTHRPTNLDIRFQTPNCLVPTPEHCLSPGSKQR